MSINRNNFNPDNVVMADFLTGDLPRNQADGVITEVIQGSAIMRLAKEVPMTKPIEEFTYMTGVGAYWIGEGQRIETSKPTMVKAEMVAKKLAVIVPITNEALNHTVSNFFELMRPQIVEAFHMKLDQAVFVGSDSPWNTSILEVAQNSGNVVPSTGNKYTDINNAMELIEAEDGEPNGIATVRSQLASYRGTRTEDGMPIFTPATDGVTATVLGLPLVTVPKTSFDGQALDIVADWDGVRFGILDDVSFKILDQGSLQTVTGEDGMPINLGEMDMQAIRVTMSIGTLITDEDAFAVVTP